MRKIIVVIFVLLVVLSSCVDKKSYLEEADIDEIKIEITDIYEREEFALYTLLLTNNNDISIESVDLMMGFATKQEYKDKGYNKDIMFKAKPEEEPYSVESGDSMMYIVEVPLNLLNQDVINFDKVQISLSGYFNEVKMESGFQKIGGISFFE